MKITTLSICRREMQNGKNGIWKTTASLILAMLFIAVPFAAEGLSQKASSIVIRDSTSAVNGGANATSSLRNAIESALIRENPCLETTNDQVIEDALQDERDRVGWEGGDSSEALKAIADRIDSDLAMSVKALPGPNGSVIYSAFAINMKTATSIARESGGSGSEQEIADKLARSIAPYTTKTCKPHWVGTIVYYYSKEETKQKTDDGRAYEGRRNVTRELTATTKMTTIIKATLRPPIEGKSVTSPTANVSHRVRYFYTRISKYSGQQRCRLPGKSTFWKDFSEAEEEITTKIGEGRGIMPVFIVFDRDEAYTIRVNAPKGTMLGKVEFKSQLADCGEAPPPPTSEAKNLDEGELSATGFEATGKIEAKNRTSLSGQQTLADGKTKIEWKLRLVGPMEKK